MSCQALKTLNLTMSLPVVNNAVKSYTLSNKYMKVTLRICLLNILYQRITMDPQDFIKKEMEKVPFVVFKRKSKNSIIQKYHGWVNGLTDAFDKNFLKEIHLLMKDNVTKDIVEYYKFSIKYNLDQNIESTLKSDDIRKQTSELLQSLNCLGTFPKLANETELVVEFAYFDCTPEDYEPPGFEPSLLPLSLSMNSTLPPLITLAAVNTGYHRLAVRARGEIFKPNTDGVSLRVNVEEETSNPMDIVEKPLISSPKITEASKGDSQASSSTETAETTLEEIERSNSYSSKLSQLPSVIRPEDANKTSGQSSSFQKRRKKCYVSDITVTETDSSCSSEDYNTPSLADENAEIKGNECTLCKWPINGVGVGEVIQCNKCKTFYHSVCHGYIDNSHNSNAFFCCVVCDHRSDHIMKELIGINRILLARLRLNLASVKLLHKLEPLSTAEDRNAFTNAVKKYGWSTSKNGNKVCDNSVILDNLISDYFLITTDSQMFP